jgi:hypothetical protein
MIHEKDEFGDIKNMFDDNWCVKGDERYIYISFKNSEGRSISLELCQQIEDDFEEESKKNFKNTFIMPGYTFINYRDLDLLHDVLKIIVQGMECYIDNDHDTLLSGLAFIQKWDQSPDWNWESEYH